MTPVVLCLQASYDKELSASLAKEHLNRSAMYKKPRKPKNKWKDKHKKSKFKNSEGETSADNTEPKEDNGAVSHKTVEIENGKTARTTDDAEIKIDNVTEQKDKKAETDTCLAADGDKLVRVTHENKDAKDNEEERTTPVEPPPKVQKVVDPNMPSFRATCHR